MAGRERRVGAVVPGIELDRLLEQCDGLEGVGLGLPAQMLPALEQRVIGARIVRLRLRDPGLLLARELHRQRRDDLPDDLVLECEHVAERAVIALRPQVMAADAHR